MGGTPGGQPGAAAVSALLPGGLASSTAAVGGAYQDLFTNTITNLQSLGATWAANPAPFLGQIVSNQFGYGQLIFAALGNATRDFTLGLAGLPPTFQTAFQAVLAGDFSGAASDMAEGLSKLVATGVDTSDLSNIKLLGPVGDLLPILRIPGDTAFNVANVIRTPTDTTVSVEFTSYVPPAITGTFGLPVALTLDAAGSAVTTANAVGTSVTALTNAVQAGDWPAAIGALVDAPAVVANGFLNGQGTMTVPLSVPIVDSAVINFPVNGILVPPHDYTATVVIAGFSYDVPIMGTPIGGIVPGLLTYAPQQFANAIGAAG
ncbi:PE-PGRS family protein [Mycobacterium pseudoshottsii JCM 15466]|nr:PE-PGRS family protein [Mycobacterium pseudoshottsii JCM 15466]